MKPSTHPIIFIIFHLILMSKSAVVSKEDYAHLISNIHEYSKSSSTALMYSSDEDSYSQENFIFNIQLLLSKQKIMTSTTDLRKDSSTTQEGSLNSKTLVGDVRITRVFFFKSEADTIRMQEILKLQDPIEIINLVLFMTTEETGSYEICMNPERNPFRLDAGVSLLVKCYENIMIREWHFLEENHIRVYNRGTWEPQTGLNLSSKSLVLNDIEILNEKAVRTVLVEPAGSISAEYKYDFRHAIEQAGNFTIEIVKEVDKTSPWNSSIKAWGGAVGSLINGNIDMAITFITLESARSSAIDSTDILFRTDVALIFKKPETRVIVSWNAFLKPFTVGLWFLLILFLFIFLFLHVIMRISKLRNSHDDEPSSNDFLHIWGMFCQQNSRGFPNALYLRIFDSTVFIFTLSVFSIYSASFVCHLTAIDPNLPFKSLREFARVKSHKLVVTDHVFTYQFQNANDFLWREISKLMLKLPEDKGEIMRMVCDEKVAVFTSVLYWTYIHNSSESRCPVMKVATELHEYTTFPLRKDGRYTRGINYMLQKLRSAGILNRLKLRFYKKVVPIATPDSYESSYSAVSSVDTATPILILLGGIIFSILILILEGIVTWFQKRKTVDTVEVIQPFTL